VNSDQFLAINQCLRHLTTATSTAGLYAPDHPQVVRLCQQAHEELVRGMAGMKEMSLLRVDDQLAVEGQPLDRTLYTERFALLLKRRGIGHLKFTSGIAVDELMALSASLVGTQTVMLSSRHLRLGQVEVRHRQDGATDSGQLGVSVSEIFGMVSQEELARIMEIYEAVRRGRQLHVVGLSEIIAKFIDVFAHHADPLLALVPLRDLDEYTFTHSLNVCLLNLAQASSLGIKDELLNDIGLAAMLHDIGKLFVPVEVLTKPGALTDDEWALMRAHPVKGAEFLLGHAGVPRLAVINAYEHHLRFDLGGYPRLREGWQQNLVSQMTTISDMYDALRTRRPYREPLSAELVLEQIIKYEGTQLHPLLAKNFKNMMCKVHPELVDKLFATRV
jgi:HD-GYP domain-containing protein (c-di-GMP phosphodiesterase class II)